MKIRNLIVPILCLAATALSGCGGGGEGAPSTIVNGLASKGPIRGGTVDVYAIRNGVPDSTPLKSGNTDDSGNYSIDLGSYQGPAMVKVSGGTFTDEVSGSSVGLNIQLEAVVSNVSTGTNKVAVTPYTDMASKLAKYDGGGAYSAAAIEGAKSKTAALFNLTDIIATMPDSSGSDDEKKYAAACGTISQLANDSRGTGQSLDDSLSNVMAELEDEMEHSGGLSDDSMTRIDTAATTFSNSGKSPAPVPVVSPTRGVLKMSTTGNENIIGAIDLTLRLPAGVTVNADPTTGEVTGGAVTVSGVAAVGSSKLVVGKYIPAAGTPAQLQISLINATGFGLGEFLTINFVMAAGATFPARATDFSVTSFSAKSLDTALLSGVSAAPTSLTGI